MKKIIFILIFFLLSVLYLPAGKAGLLFASYSANAQTGYPIVNTATTVVGEGGEPVLTPTPDGGNSEIARWAVTITSRLKKEGLYCLYNVQPYNNICNNNYCATRFTRGDCSGWWGYLCTQLVIDSYNLAGNKNSFSTNTYFMEQAWEGKAGYRVMKTNSQSSLSQLRSGDVIFMFATYSATSLKHVVVIKDVNIDSNGNGEIDILQSNSHTTSSYYPVSRWKVIHYYRDDPNAILMFGLGPRK